MEELLKIRIKKKRQILFDKEDEIIQDFLHFLESYSRKVIILLYLDIASELVIQLEKKYPLDSRFRNCVETSRDWAFGKVKMKEAKQAILSCHSVSKEIEDKSLISKIHAIGQACSIIHTMGHVPGLPIYDLTSIIYECGIDLEKIKDRIFHYKKRTIYWNQHIDEYTTWASFLK